MIRRALRRKGYFGRRLLVHDDVIKWKHFPRYWPFVRGIHRSPVNSPHKGQWRGALMFSLICAWIKGSVNNGEVGDLNRHRTHYDVIVMIRNLAHGKILFRLCCTKMVLMTDIIRFIRMYLPIFSWQLQWWSVCHATAKMLMNYTVET